MDKQQKSVPCSRKSPLICSAPERERQISMPPAAPDDHMKLEAAEYRLGVKKYGGTFVETLLFLRAGGLEIGYYTIHFDFDGCFMDFTSFDEEKEIRAVYERFTACDDGKTTLAGALELDLRAMGYYIPQLRTELTDLRLTCESSARCGSIDCRMNCPLQYKYRPKISPK